MTRTLAELAASGAPVDERLRVARELARVAADLAARGKVHGALAPGAVVVLDGGAVVARPAAAGGWLARAGFDAPEVARGGRPSRRSDAFSVGALAWLALAGRGPFEGDEPLETVRRVLHEEPAPVRLHAPGVPLEVEAAIAALLEKRARRRAAPGDLVRAIDASAVAAPGRGAGGTLPRPGGEADAPAPAASRSPRRSRRRAAGARGASATRRALRASARALALVLRVRAPALARAVAAAGARAVRAAVALPPLPRTTLAAIPLVAATLAVLPRTDAALARDVRSLLARGEVARAQGRLEDAAARRPHSPVVEKLRGDVACARGAPGECLRRYRVALAAREDLREDAVLRANARRLVGREQSCATRRAAARLLGELRDPDALPALEEARRSRGLLAVFCTGDTIDRAIAATRAVETERWP